MTYRSVYSCSLHVHVNRVATCIYTIVAAHQRTDYVKMQLAMAYEVSL